MRKSFNIGARIIFVSVMGINLGLLLLAEIWWWARWQAKAAPVLISGYQSRGGEVVAGKGWGNVFEPVVVAKENVVADDARVRLIEDYLRKYKSPLLPYSRLIFDLSESYDFEYYWIPAIAQQESNLCKKIPADSFNCWGYGIHAKGTLKFDNYELALKSFAEYFKREYFDKGYRSPEEIMKKYCPNSNGSWASGVKQFIEEIESGGNNV